MNKNVKQILTESEIESNETLTDEEMLEKANDIGEMLERFQKSPMNKMRRFIFRVKRMWKIMWEVGKYDLDWDYCSITYFMLWKLDLMIAFFESNKAWSVEAPEVAKEMREARDLIKKFNDFESPEWEEHKEKYGELEFNTEDSSLRCWHTKCNSKELETDASNESIRIYQEEEQERSNALKKAFYLIGDNIEKWWD